jgi:hypothetical protein
MIAFGAIEELWGADSISSIHEARSLTEITADRVRFKAARRHSVRQTGISFPGLETNKVQVAQLVW